MWKGLEGMDDYENLNAALVQLVRVIGGSKRIGVALWPALGVEAAQRRLLASLNDERPEKLGPEEVLHLLRLGREAGCHVGMAYIAHHLGYAEPVPVVPADEAQALRRQVLDMGAALQATLTRLERLERPAAGATSKGRAA